MQHRNEGNSIYEVCDLIIHTVHSVAHHSDVGLKRTNRFFAFFICTWGKQLGYILSSLQTCDQLAVKQANQSKPTFNTMKESHFDEDLCM